MGPSSRQEVHSVGWPPPCGSGWLGSVCQALHCRVGLSCLEAILVFFLSLACGADNGGTAEHPVQSRACWGPGLLRRFPWLTCISTTQGATQSPLHTQVERLSSEKLSDLPGDKSSRKDRRLLVFLLRGCLLQVNLSSRYLAVGLGFLFLKNPNHLQGSL